MPGHEHFFPVVEMSYSCMSRGFGVLLGYGPLPGLELIPFFIALLVWVGLALLSVLLWPICGLVRCLRKPRTAPPQ